MHQGENISSEERDERAKLGRSLASHQAKEKTIPAGVYFYS
jgi:hypothetical protein